MKEVTTKIQSVYCKKILRHKETLRKPSRIDLNDREGR